MHEKGMKAGEERASTESSPSADEFVRTDRTDGNDVRQTAAHESEARGDAASDKRCSEKVIGIHRGDAGQV